MTAQLFLLLVLFLVGSAAAWTGLSGRTLPRRLSLILGPALGASLMGLQLLTTDPKSRGGLHSLALLAFGAALGLAGGALVSWLDRPRASEFDSRDQGEPSPLLSRFLRLAAILFCWLPMFGLVMGIAALIADRHGSTRPGLALRIATAIGLLTTLGFVWMMILAPPK